MRYHSLGKPSIPFAFVIILCMISSCAKPASETQLTNRRTLTYLQPQDVKEPIWLADRMAAQLENNKLPDVYSDFSFVDQLKASGITFKNTVVDDAGIAYKPVHYDHGNGISVADIDNDGYYDIYFTNQVGSNALWKNMGQGKFIDITEQAGVGMQEQISVSSSFADIDNDGDQDLFVTTVRFGNVLFENKGDGKFEDITRRSGLSYSGHSSAAVFFDYNRDGRLDLFLTNVGTYTTDTFSEIKGVPSTDSLEGEFSYYVGIGDTAFTGHLYPELSEQSIMYENKGDNKFEDVSERIGLADERWSGDATVIDGNLDGWPDLYILNMQGDDGFYENIEGQRFELRTSSYFPKTPYGSMGIKVLDVDNDGLFDIFITDMHSDMWETNQFFDVEREKHKPAPENVPPLEELGTSQSIYGNALFKNLNNGSFEEIADTFNAETYWPWGLSSGDLNADGYEDVLITASMNFPFRYAVNSVLLNNQGNSFVSSEFILGVEPRENSAKLWYEINCLTTDDELCEPFDNTYVIDVWGAMGSRASVIFDLEEDGDLDIVTNEFNAQPQVLISDLSASKALHFLKIDFEGTVSNRNGLGAVVEITTRERVFKKANDGKSGYLSQSVFPLYFGFENQPEIQAIKVYWPSGIIQEINDAITLNTVLKVVEPRQ